MDSRSLQKKPKYVGLGKLPSGYLLGLLNKIAAAFRVELSEATLAVYLEYMTDEGWSVPIKSTEPEAIVDLKEWMDSATFAVITEWDEPSKMPPLKFILERFAPPEQKPQLVPFPKLEIKPEGWEPLDSEEKSVMFQEAFEKAAAEKEMNHPAERSLHDQQRAMALSRLGGSTMPSDPVARKQWAHEMAIKNGWIPKRQPGEDD